MNRIVHQFAQITVVASMCTGPGAAWLEADEAAAAVVASGTLHGRFRAASLFHIDEFWMQVASGTDFHRWLSQGLGRLVVVRLTADATQVHDEKRMRILTGTLVHETAPRPTSITTNVVGRLPEGDSGLVHVFFVTDEIAGRGTLSAVTFETADLATVSKFAAYEGGRINIVIEIH
jgi:hypothetical protein